MVARNDECVVRRVVAAPPDRVFQIWTEPSFAQRWSWGPRFDTLSVVIDCRPGGAWEQEVRDRETGEVWTFRGEFREVKPGRRLVHTFHWKSDRGTDEGESIVAIDFLPEGQNTQVVIVHSGLHDPKKRDGTYEGWLEVIDCVQECAR